MGLGREREAASKGPIRNVDLPQKNGKRARLQALFERPDEIDVTGRLDHDECVWIESQGGKPRTVRSSKFASAVPRERP